jgi:carboxyl-terminal processing protease
VWTKVLDKHFDPTLGCLDWPALRVRYGQAIAAADADDAAYAQIAAMVGELGQSHFAVVPPRCGGDAPPDLADTLPGGPATAPVEVRWIAEQLVVTRSDDAALPAGAIVARIGEHDAARLVAIARAEAERGGDLDTPSGLAFHVGRTLQLALSGPPGTARTVVFTAPGGARREASVALREFDGERVTLGNLRDLPTRVEHRVVQSPGGAAVGVVAFNIWMLPLVDRVRASVDEVRRAGARAIVLDLRGNPGGVGLMAVPVARLFLAEGGHLGKLQYRDFAQDFAVPPDAGAFTGPLRILVDEGTASTSEIFATGMRDIGRARIVGGRTSAGAALPSIIEELPPRDVDACTRGAIVQYVVGDYLAPGGGPVEGHGVALDVRVDERPAAFVAGGDPVLAGALADLDAALAAG